jgi:hypothetical protein
MRTLGAAVALLAALGEIGVATAEPPAAPALSWLRVAGAETCIGGPELAEQVEAQLGRPVLVALPQAQLTVEGSVAPEAEGFRVYLRLSNRDGGTRGERALAVTTQDCRALDPLLVFLIALMLDPDAPLLPPRLPSGLSESTRAALADLFGNEPTVPPLELAAPSGRDAPAAVAPAREPSRAPRGSTTTDALEADDAPAPGWSFGVQAEALAAIGLLPRPGAGFRLGVVAAPADGFRLELGGALFLENAIAGEEASFSLVQGELAACPALARLGAALALWGCARLSAGALLARGEGAGARDTDRLVLHAGAGPEFALALGARASLHLGVAAIVPVVRDRYFLSRPQGRDVAFRMSPVVGQANLALQLRPF